MHLAAVAAAAPLPRHVLVYEDEEYPFASGAINGIKACTKCGATKTPQWREGPLGELVPAGRAQSAESTPSVG